MKIRFSSELRRGVLEVEKDVFIFIYNFICFILLRVRIVLILSKILTD